MEATSSNRLLPRDTRRSWPKPDLLPRDPGELNCYKTLPWRRVLLYRAWAGMLVGTTARSLFFGFEDYDYGCE